MRFSPPRHLVGLAAIAAFAALTTPARSAEETAAAPAGLFPFILPWDDASAGVTDLSAWQPEPAGARGFVFSADGHLFVPGRQKGERERIRFLGVNMSFAANFPTAEEAEKIAARLAKFGVNCVRFHHMDRETAPKGLWKTAEQRELDPEQLERLDGFIAALKRRGIYANINLHVSRSYAGFPTGEGIPYAHKGLDLFTPGMIEAQKTYARQLLHHVNRHTGKRYAEEPAVAFVEINNENGIVCRWWDRSLDALPAALTEELGRRWHEWLVARHGSAAAALDSWRGPKIPLGDELLRNWRFAEGSSGWTLEQPQTEEPWLEVKPAKSGVGVTLNITRTEGERRGEFFQRGIRLEPGRLHTLRLRAESVKPGKVVVSLKDARPPWRIHASVPVELTGKEVTLETSFLYEGEADAELRVNFSQFSDLGAPLTLRGVSLKPGGVAAVPSIAAGRVGWPRRADFQRYALGLQRDWLRFLSETERGYWADMREYLVKDLGVRPLVIGSQLGAYSTSPMQADMDVIDLHAYWSHPDFNSKRRDWGDVTVKNASMVNAADGAYAALPSLYRVQGKPYLITEYNHCSPNTYSAEGFPIIAAYAAMQDWDGVFVYSYSHRNFPFDSGRMPGIFDIDQHPVKMATLPIAAALFRRGDVAVSSAETVVTISPEKAIDVMRKNGTRVTADRFGVSRHDALRRRIAVRLAEDSPDPVPAPTPGYEGPIASENGQLVWDAKEPEGAFTVDTARTKAAIGFGKDRVHRLGALQIKTGETVQNWSTIALSQMDGAELGTKGRALLVACGYIQNTGMTWRDADKHIPGDWGRAPTLIEGVPAEFSLKTAGSVEVWSLDERGQRKERVPVSIAGGNATWSIGAAYKTLWYEVNVR